MQRSLSSSPTLRERTYVPPIQFVTCEMAGQVDFAWKKVGGEGGGGLEHPLPLLNLRPCKGLIHHLTSVMPHVHIYDYIHKEQAWSCIMKTLFRRFSCTLMSHLRISLPFLPAAASRVESLLRQRALHAEPRSRTTFWVTPDPLSGTNWNHST